jgi:hypothetical protein
VNSPLINALDSFSDIVRVRPMLVSFEINDIGVGKYDVGALLQILMRQQQFVCQSYYLLLRSV